MGSRKSQWKKRKTRNIPPPARSIGEDCSMASWTWGSLLKVAVRAPIGPREGLTPQTISKGKKPRTKKTAMRIPQMRNHLRAFSPMVLSTSALMTALSMELMVSKRAKPKTVKKDARINSIASIVALFDGEVFAIFFSMEDCIFCKIVNGEAPYHKIWEDEKHLAFLSIFPNTEGFSVVITKEHYPSYVFELPEEVLKDLVVAAKKVGKLLDEKMKDVGRTGLVFEGFGVDHAHAKLIPMHGTKLDKWEALHSQVDKYFEKYEGYLSSHDYKREDDEKLAKLARIIRDE